MHLTAFWDTATRPHHRITDQVQHRTARLFQSLMLAHIGFATLAAIILDVLWVTYEHRSILGDLDFLIVCFGLLFVALAYGFLRTGNYLTGLWIYIVTCLLVPIVAPFMPDPNAEIGVLATAIIPIIVTAIAFSPQITSIVIAVLAISSTFLLQFSHYDSRSVITGYSILVCVVIAGVLILILRRHFKLLEEERINTLQITANALKKSEQALQEKEDLFQLFMDHCPVYVFFKDQDLKTLLLSRNFENMIGRPLNTLLGKPMFDLFPTEFAQKMIEDDKQIIAQRQSIELYEELNGRQYITTKFPISRPGSPVLLAGFTMDITDWKRTENELKASEARYRFLADHMNDTVSLMDLNWYTTYISPSIERVRGYTLEEIQQLPMEKQITAESYERAIKAYHEELQKAMADPNYNFSRSIELEFYRKDGSTYWSDNTFSLIRDEQGKPFAVLGEGKNITAKKRAEAALRLNEERMQLALDATNTGLWDWDLSNDQNYYSPGWLKLLGYSQAEVDANNRLWTQTMMPEDVAKVREGLDRHLSGETPMFVMEYRKRKKSGDWIWILDCGRIVERDSEGKPLRIVGTITDISDRKHAEEESAKLEAQLQQAQKMESVGRLAGGVAHDFNNMLQAILGNVELAIQNTADDKPVLENLAEIQKCAQRSADLTRQLLAFARKQTVIPKVLNLNETIDGMLKMLRRLIGEDIDLQWLPAPNLWSVRMDPSQIDQILANLCVNSRDAIGNIGKIAIETHNLTVTAETGSAHSSLPIGEYIHLVVRDTGCGMNRETIDRLFEPFFTTKETGKGTGLGLATVYGIVRQNNGMIEVESEIGQGTTFNIYLPRFQGTTRSASVSEEQTLDIYGNEIILLVEDETAVLKMISKVLERQGYTLLKALSPLEALKLAEEYAGEIQLVLTDVVMPEMNGWDMTVALKEKFPTIKCLFMSGYSAEILPNQTTSDKTIYFIQKPFTMRSLSEKLRVVLDDKQY